MNKVVNITDGRPHLGGPARCLDCLHEWNAVAPVGTVAMDCPKCGAAKAARFSMVLPKDHEGVWTCFCGNSFMMITTDNRALCPNCGASQDFPLV